MSKDKEEGAASKLLECVQQLSVADILAMPLQQWVALFGAAAVVVAPIFGAGYGFGRGKERRRAEAALNDLSICPA